MSALRASVRFLSSSAQAAPRVRVSVPHAVSNIRMFELPASESESPAEALYRKEVYALQQWHHNYWLAHNTYYEERKAAHIAEYKSKHSLADEAALPEECLAEFYQSFLKETYNKNKQYTIETWKANFALLGPWARATKDRTARSLGLASLISKRT